MSMIPVNTNVNSNGNTFFNNLKVMLEQHMLTLKQLRSSSEQIDCEIDYFLENCEYPELFSMLPSSIEEYNAICPKLKNYAKCTKDFQDACGLELQMTFFPNDEMYEDVYSISSDVCDEDKLIYEVITENLRCLNETFENSPCYDEIEATMQEHAPNIVRQNNSLLPSEIYCLREILSTVCYTNDIQKNCGELASDMAKEFIRRSYFIEYSCDIMDAKVLLEDVGRYKLKSHEQDYLVKIMGDLVTRYGDE
ncbi:uncharacterized protein CDAR_386211 [Caerostris darwini]|uniref:Uncharacterized protein n=1 Tax=Caerostris darwini TaxID=1538125 RepID=A0AAV4SH29_9ARAC|nr:uncharacterized protein CDAR_386211 [Caerostris darwini]